MKNICIHLQYNTNKQMNLSFQIYKVEFMFVDFFLCSVV